MNADWLPSIERFATILGWTLLHSFWQAALLWLGIRAIKSRTIDPRTRYTASTTTLGIFVAIQIVTFALCAQWSLLAPRWLRPEVPVVAASDRLFLEMPTASASSWIGSTVAWVEPLLPWLIAAWGGWALVRLVAQVRGMLAASRTLSLAPSLPPDLLDRCVSLAAKIGVQSRVSFVVAAISDAPGTLGWLRPYVFIPPAILLSMTPAQLEAFVAHELAHVARRDYAAAMLALAVDACYACNPFVRAIVRQLQADAELCCDLLAVRHVGDPHGYATALATLADGIVRQRAQTVSIGANGGALVERVLSILQPAPVGRASWSKALLSLVIAAALLLTSGASLGKVASREAETRWLATRTLNEAVREILHANPEPSTPERELILSIANDTGYQASKALGKVLLQTETLMGASRDANTRQRLLAAASFEDNRYRELRSRLPLLWKQPVSSPGFRALLSELRFSTFSQKSIANEAIASLDAHSRKEWASAAEAAFPGELDTFVQTLRSNLTANTAWIAMPAKSARVVQRRQPTTSWVPTTRKAM